MSEVTTPAATATPAAPQAPAVPAPATTAPAGAPPAPAGDPNNPPWLKDRLEQERRTYLAELGITDPAKAKEAIAAAAKAEEDAKSQGQKLGEASKALEAERAEKARLANVIKDHATLSLGRLSEADRDRVRKLAPDTDPAEQLRIIDVMFPGAAAPVATPATPAATTTPAAPTTTPAQPAAPASTAPAPTAPPGGSVSNPDHKAVHAQLEKTNPFAAANYALEHLAEVYPDQPATS